MIGVARDQLVFADAGTGNLTVESPDLEYVTTGARADRRIAVEPIEQRVRLLS